MDGWEFFCDISIVSLPLHLNLPHVYIYFAYIYRENICKSPFFSLVQKFNIHNYIYTLNTDGFMQYFHNVIHIGRKIAIVLLLWLFSRFNCTTSIVTAKKDIHTDLHVSVTLVLAKIFAVWYNFSLSLSVRSWSFLPLLPQLKKIIISRICT